MLCIIRHWRLKEGVKKEDFFRKWHEGTADLLKNHNSLGASLHEHSDGTLWVYARWPNKEIQSKASEARKLSGEFSNEQWIDVIETIELELVDDQLKMG